MTPTRKKLPNKWALLASQHDNIIHRMKCNRIIKGIRALTAIDAVSVFFALSTHSAW